MTKEKFAASATPHIIGVVRERTPAAALQKIRAYEAHGATAIDLHLSCLDEEYKTVPAMRRIAEGTKLPILALNYSLRYDWTPIDETEEERAQFLAQEAANDTDATSYDSLPQKSPAAPTNNE